MDILSYAKPQEIQLHSVPQIEIREEGDRKNKKRKVFLPKDLFAVILSKYILSKTNSNNDPVK